MPEATVDDRLLERGQAIVDNTDSHAQTTSVDLAPRAILVVDDDAALRDIIAETLTEAGYAVDTAVNGRDGLEKFHVDRHGLVVTDIIMPEEEGFGLLRRLRDLAPELPVIVVSGGGAIAAADYLDLASHLGARVTLAKPFRRHQLLDAVAALLPAG